MFTRFSGICFVLSTSLCLAQNVLGQDFPRAKEVIVAPSPSAGKLEVRGEPGIGQESFFYLNQCTADPKTIYQQVSCVTLPSKFNLNTPISLATGVYSIYLENQTGKSGSDEESDYAPAMIHNVLIKSGETKIVDLHKIEIPNVPPFKFQIFQDITDTAQFKTFLLSIWARSWNEGTHPGYSFITGRIDALVDPKLERAYHEGPEKMINAITSTNKTADYLRLKYDRYQGKYEWDNLGKVYLNPPVVTGNFISVFEGTYGIEYRDDIGVKATYYGIKAE